MTIIYLNSTKHHVIWIEKAHFLCDTNKYFTLEELQHLQFWSFQGCWLQYLVFRFNQCVPVCCLTNNHQNNNSVPTHIFQIIDLLCHTVCYSDWYILNYMFRRIKAAKSHHLTQYSFHYVFGLHISHNMHYDAESQKNWKPSVDRHRHCNINNSNTINILLLFTTLISRNCVLSDAVHLCVSVISLWRFNGLVATVEKLLNFYI
jgi:hypothetical protein